MSTNSLPLQNLPDVNSRVIAPARWRKQALRVVLQVVIFVSGAVTGGGALLLYNVPREDPVTAIPAPLPAADPDNFDPSRSVERLVNRFKERYNVTDAQAEQIEVSARRMFTSMHTIRTTMEPQMRTEATRFEEDVSRVLDDGQREKWKQSLKEFRRPWHRGRHRGGPDGRAPRTDHGPRDGHGPRDLEFHGRGPEGHGPADDHGPGDRPPRDRGPRDQRGPAEPVKVSPPADKAD